MMSSACPVACSLPLSAARRPLYPVIAGNLAQTARWTRIASGVRPFSTAEPDLQAAEEMPPATAATGFVADRYCALTQRATPSRTISAQMPWTLPVTDTLLPRGSTVSRVPFWSAALQILTSVVVYLLPITLGGAARAARVFAEDVVGIGACFLMCFAPGVALGFGAVVGDRLSVGRSASRLAWVSRAICRAELAVGVPATG